MIRGPLSCHTMLYFHWIKVFAKIQSRVAWRNYCYFIIKFNSNLQQSGCSVCECLFVNKKKEGHLSPRPSHNMGWAPFPEGCFDGECYWVAVSLTFELSLRSENVHTIPWLATCPSALLLFQAVVGRYWYIVLELLYICRWTHLTCRQAGQAKMANML